MEKTTEMMSARKEVARVPTRKGNRQIQPLPDPIVELNREPEFQNCEWQGKEAMAREKNMAIRRSRTNTPAMDSIFRKDDSESAGLCHCIVFVLDPIPEAQLCCGSFFMYHLFYHEADISGWKNRTTLDKNQKLFRKPVVWGGRIPPRLPKSLHMMLDLVRDGFYEFSVFSKSLLERGAYSRGSGIFALHESSTRVA